MSQQPKLKKSDIRSNYQSGIDNFVSVLVSNRPIINQNQMKPVHKQYKSYDYDAKYQKL